MFLVQGGRLYAPRNDASFPYHLLLLWCRSLEPDEPEVLFWSVVWELLVFGALVVPVGQGFVLTAAPGALAQPVIFWELEELQNQVHGDVRHLSCAMPHVAS